MTVTTGFGPDGFDIDSNCFAILSRACVSGTMKRNIVYTAGSEDAKLSPSVRSVRSRRLEVPHLSYDIIVERICSYLDFVSNFHFRTMNKTLRELMDVKLKEKYPELSVQLNVLFWDNSPNNLQLAYHDQIVVRYKEAENAVVFDSIQHEGIRTYESQYFPVNRRLPSIAGLKPATLSLRGWMVPKSSRHSNLQPLRGFVGADIVNHIAKQAGGDIKRLYLASFVCHPRGRDPLLPEVFSRFQNLTELYVHSYIYLSTLVDGIIQVQSLRYLQLHVNNRNLSQGSTYHVNPNLYGCMEQLNQLPHLDSLKIIPRSVRSREHFRLLSTIPRITRLKTLNLFGISLNQMPQILSTYPYLEDLSGIQIDVATRTRWIRQESRNLNSHAHLKTLRIQIFEDNTRSNISVLTALLDFCISKLPNLTLLEVHFDARHFRGRTVSGIFPWIREYWEDGENLSRLSLHPALTTIKIAVAKNNITKKERSKLERKSLPRLLRKLNHSAAVQISETPFMMGILRDHKDFQWLPLSEGRRQMSDLPTWQGQLHEQTSWCIPSLDLRYTDEEANSVEDWNDSYFRSLNSDSEFEYEPDPNLEYDSDTTSMASTRQMDTFMENWLTE